MSVFENLVKYRRVYENFQGNTFPLTIRPTNLRYSIIPQLTVNKDCK